MKHILVVEDDVSTSKEIVEALQDYGFSVETAFDGKQGLVKALTGSFDAIVLDRMLPNGLDGLGVLLALRTANINTPVLILSALSQLDERVQGLRAGGDDYLCKPFEFIEFTARLEALTRRNQQTTQQQAIDTSLQLADLHIDKLRRTVKRAERVIDLVPREYELLLYMAERADQIVTKAMLFEAVWGYHYHEQTNVIEVHIGRLRKKIDAEGEEPMIHTIRGAGYVLRTTA